MDEATGWCVGCLRTLHEIGGWSGMDETGKRAVMADLPARRGAWRRLRAAAGGGEAAAAGAAAAPAASGASAESTDAPAHGSGDSVQR